MTETEAFNNFVVAAIEEMMCKKCNQYETGCTPFQIIECTEYFLNKVRSK